MDNCSKPKIELTTSSADWSIIRECYVKSFFRYPLYKYMVPDETKREDFLRAYLDANFEVTVGSGQGILLAIKVPFAKDENKNIQHKVVGGVVFVPPSNDGCGWAIGDDKPYWDAYEKYRLGKISPEGLERVKRYEAWENDHVAQKASASRIPLWNGLFCAIDPEYTSKGVGSAVYKEAIRIMAKFWVKQQNDLQENNQKQQQMKQDQEEIPKKDFENSSVNCTLLHHRVISPAAFAKTQNKQQTESTKKSSQTKKVSIQEMMYNPSAPLVVAVSHSDRAARFHESNGFQPVSRLPFYDAVDDITPFNTHVLVLDPFCTGRITELTTSLLETKKNLKDEVTPVTLYDDINKINPCSVLI